MPTKRKYWLMKSEPDVFSIEDLEKKKSEGWDGVRNYQARNFMREMREGDLVLFYHSNAKPSGVAGVATIVGEARPDPTQFDPHSPYFDAKSQPEAPRWQLVDVQALRKTRVLGLAEMRSVPELAEMQVLKRGNRLSITPVRRATSSARRASVTAARASALAGSPTGSPSASSVVVARPQRIEKR